MPTFPINPGVGARFTFGRPRPARLSVASLEAVRVTVAATLGESVVDPTNDAVYLAFTGVGATPGSGDFVAGDWDTTAAGSQATCLVGPGGSAVLTAGLYSVWCKVSDDPEIPVRLVGDLGVW